MVQLSMTVRYGLCTENTFKFSSRQTLVLMYTVYFWNGWTLLDAEHSLCMAPWSGTLCWTTSAHSRTMSPLDRVWKPGFSPDTSVFSALETFVIIALYKSTFTIPYHRLFWVFLHWSSQILTRRSWITPKGVNLGHQNHIILLLGGTILLYFYFHCW